MGKTIVISSHILHELAELCNMVGIVEQGKLLFSGSVDEIMQRAHVGKLVQIGLENRIKDAGKMLMQLPAVARVELVRERGEPLLEVVIRNDAEFPLSELASRLIAQGYRVAAMQQEQVNLETAFMRLTKGIVS